MSERDNSIDILKFLAALLITNSHMEILYGQYSWLATGGAIGDSIFFFCSGYTLFLGRVGNFFNWYKRRINRIYPTVFAWMLVCCIVWNWNINFLDILFHGGGWFVECIMIYYVIIWFVNKYFINHLKIIFVLSTIIVSLKYFVDRAELSRISIYGLTTFKYWLFFLSMLAGSMFGLARKQSSFKIGSWYLNLICILFFIVLFYGFSYICTLQGLEFLQLLTIFPLIAISIYLYKFCSSTFMLKMLRSKQIGLIVKFIGGLCLEIYIVQYNLYTDRLNFLFPLNIPIMFLYILCTAYLLKCLAKIWKQTFSEDNYSWKSIINPF